MSCNPIAHTVCLEACTNKLMRFSVSWLCPSAVSDHWWAVPHCGFTTMAQNLHACSTSMQSYTTHNFTPCNPTCALQAPYHVCLLTLLRQD